MFMKDVSKIELYVTLVAIVLIIIPMLFTLEFSLTGDFLDRSYERVYKFKSGSKANW